MLTPAENQERPAAGAQGSAPIPSSPSPPPWVTHPAAIQPPKYSTYVADPRSEAGFDPHLPTRARR